MRNRGKRLRLFGCRCLNFMLFSVLESVMFSSLAGTDATYTGEGTSSIFADDQVEPISRFATWGFVGNSPGSEYTLTYTSTRVGFGEVMALTGVPEPNAPAVILYGCLLGIPYLRQRTR